LTLRIRKDLKDILITAPGHVTIQKDGVLWISNEQAELFRVDPLQGRVFSRLI
jgi:hypothetical protein